ncbi:MAG: N-acetyl-alpha-D-glucosaminyl L-malate synthase BshA [Candidatus Krumholzibacteria bacterium]|jgi:N-acetyl-alpha-D-glucosaminyl L-malate synthase BshA|nr:N-acetyl-alpha-D-glucosaminyl L-malate synthase BshA [Candidatus Krumholzibacteria bacterium]
MTEDKKLKIGVTCYHKAGGSGIVATELGMALAARGHEIHFISSSTPFRLTESDNILLHRVETADYPLFDYPPYTLALAVKMHQVVSFHDLDLLHVHYAIPHAASAILARDMGSWPVPVVTTLHGTDITLVGSHPSYHRITRHCIEQSDAVTSVSEYLSKETDRIFEAKKEVKVIPNFVDSDRFSPRENQDLRSKYARAEEKIILHASNFRPVKRVPFVLEIFDKLAMRDQSILLLAGDGPDLSTVRRMARERNLEDRVHFLGACEDMETVFPLADLFLQPSEYESFGLAALEAMSCGVPCLLTNQGGTAEFLHHGDNGCLLDPEDLDLWVKTAGRLLSSPLESREMGARARDHAKRNFSLERVVKQYEDLFLSLVPGFDNPRNFA